MFFQGRTMTGLEFAVNVGGNIFSLANVVVGRHECLKN
jgi:hypothetical protein